MIGNATGFLAENYKKFSEISCLMNSGVLSA